MLQIIGVVLHLDPHNCLNHCVQLVEAVEAEGAAAGAAAGAAVGAAVGAVEAAAEAVVP